MTTLRAEDTLEVYDITTVGGPLIEIDRVSAGGNRTDLLSLPPGRAEVLAQDILKAVAAAKKRCVPPAPKELPGLARAKAMTSAQWDAYFALFLPENDDGLMTEQVEELDRAGLLGHWDDEGWSTDQARMRELEECLDATWDSLSTSELNQLSNASQGTQKFASKSMVNAGLVDEVQAPMPVPFGRAVLTRRQIVRRLETLARERKEGQG